MILGAVSHFTKLLESNYFKILLVSTIWHLLTTGTPFLFLTHDKWQKFNSRWKNVDLLGWFYFFVCLSVCYLHLSFQVLWVTSQNSLNRNIRMFVNRCVKIILICCSCTVWFALEICGNLSDFSQQPKFVCGDLDIGRAVFKARSAFSKQLCLSVRVCVCLSHFFVWEILF